VIERVGPDDAGRGWFAIQRIRETLSASPGGQPEGRVVRFSTASWRGRNVKSDSPAEDLSRAIRCAWEDPGEDSRRETEALRRQLALGRPSIGASSSPICESSRIRPVDSGLKLIAADVGVLVERVTHPQR